MLSVYAFQYTHTQFVQTLSFLYSPLHTQKIYGNHTLIKYNTQGTCKQQLLVLGLHNSGTSIVARLLSLLGLWLGEPEELSIGKKNKLKWCVCIDIYKRGCVVCLYGGGMWLWVRKGKSDVV